MNKIEPSSRLYEKVIQTLDEYSIKKSRRRLFKNAAISITAISAILLLKNKSGKKD